MARNKIGLQVNGFDDYMKKLDELGGSQAMKKGVEEALKVSKEYVTPQIEAAMNKLPAKGRYSTGATKQSIDKDLSVDWAGTVGSIKVGFDFKKSGLKSIFLMYGTPKMPPVSGLKAAIYSNKTQKKIAELQGEALTKVIERFMEG